MRDSSGPATRGLATLALLKVYFDRGRDHIGMFLPFVIDVIASRRADDFALEDIKSELSERHGLTVPANTLNTLLTRAVRQGFARRDAGRYFRVADKHHGVDLMRERARVEREHMAIVQAFKSFAQGRGLTFATDEAALALFLGFLETNHVPFLLDDDPLPRLLRHDVLSRRETATVALFIRSVLTSEPSLADYLQRMVEGLVLQNALLLKDINLAKRKFTELRVFFDTGFLLAALGITGEAAAIAARETIALLRATNASFSVFEKTVEEIRRILDVYKRLIGSTAGMKSLRPTPVTRHFLTQRYRPSDVAQVMALLETNIAQLGFTVVPFPARNPDYMLDESDLSRRLRRPDETELEPRVMHDVDSAAAILTVRAGRTTNSLDDSRAVFATTSTTVMKTIAEWYRDSGATGIPPAVHVIGLSHIAWLKKPAAAARLKLHELVVLCTAALRPSRQTWDAFLKQLRRLEESGDLSSDEAVAVVASSLTDARLAEVDSEGDVDAATVADIVERVRESHALEAQALTGRAEEQTRQATEARKAAELRAEHHAEERRQLELRVVARIDAIARYVALGVFWAGALVLIAGVCLTLPGRFPESSGLWLLVAWVVVGVVALASVAGLLWGGYLAQAQRALEAYASRCLREWFVGPGITS